jgi:hypothetical protein
MSEQCPSNFVLDAFRLGLDETPAEHVKACPRCAAWLAAQARLENEMAPIVIPAEPRRSWGIVKYLLGLGLPLAAAATALLLWFVPKPPTETAKGHFVPVQVARMRAGSVAWLPPGASLLPNDSLRFFVGKDDVEDRHVLIGSVDGSGRLSRFYPADADGCSVLVPTSGEALEGSVVIDGTAGPERIVVVLSHRPLCWTTVGEPVKRFALGAPAAGELASADVHVTRLILPKQVEDPH